MSSAQNSALWAIANGQTNQLATDQRLDAAKDASLAALDAFQAPQLGTLQGGYDQGQAEYAKAASLYDPYVSAGTSALSALSDASGVNGAAGSDRATAAFRASPGYQYDVDQATDAVARKASATGALGSGNTLAAISDRAGHMADDEYGSYKAGLSGLAQLGYGATGAQAGLTKGIGDLDVSFGRDNASVYANTGNRSAGVITGTAAGQASNDLSSTNLISSLALQGGQAADKERAANNPLSIAIGGLTGLAGLAKATNGAGMGR